MTETMKKESLVKDVFSVFPAMARSFWNGVREFAEGVKTIEWRGYCKDLVSPLMVLVAFALWTWGRKGAGDLFASIVLPLAGVAALMVLISKAYNASRATPLLLFLLCVTGAAVQLYMNPDEEKTSAYLYIAVLYAGLVAGMIFVWLFLKLDRSRIKPWVLPLWFFAGTALLYALLFILGSEKNGAKCWIYIGSDETSIQVTALTQLAAVCFFAEVNAEERFSEKAKGGLSAAMMVFQTVCLVVCSELGTLLILGAVYLIIRFINANNKRVLFSEMGVMAGLALVALVVVFVAYKVSPYADYEKQLEKYYVDLSAFNEQQAKMPLTLDQIEGKEAIVKATPPKEPNEPSVNRLARIWPKISSRFKVLFDSEKVTADESYQTDKAKEALSLTTLFGDTETSLAAVPQISDDLVTIYLFVRLGFIVALLVFAGYVGLLLVCGREAIHGKKRQGALAFALMLSIAIQAALNLASAAGFAPLVGVCLPLISSGFSTLGVTLLSATAALTCEKGE